MSVWRHIPDSSTVVRPATLSLEQARSSELGKRFGVRAVEREVDGYERGERFNVVTVQLGKGRAA